MIASTLEQIQEIKNYVAENDIGALECGIATVYCMPIKQVLLNLYKLLEPVIDIARKKFPKFFAVIDWCVATVKKIL